MKPQILVLSSTSNYLALNLEKDLKEQRIFFTVIGSHLKETKKIFGILT